MTNTEAFQGFSIQTEALAKALNKAVEGLARMEVPIGERTMEQKAVYRFINFDRPGQLNEIIASNAFDKDHIFIVTLPNSDRQTVKAVDCCFDTGCLIFEDGEGITVAAYAAGHWVRVQREEEETTT